MECREKKNIINKTLIHIKIEKQWKFISLLGQLCSFKIQMSTAFNQEETLRMRFYSDY